MVNHLESVKYAGLDCLVWGNGTLSLKVTESVGPRVLTLTIDDSPNIFADLRDLKMDCPGKGEFSFYGGHRLWHAPEKPARTYLPDDDPITVEQSGDRLVLIQKKELETGLSKEIELSFIGERSLSVKHKLVNHNTWPVTCAPWAITQLEPGGVAILPHNARLSENNPTLPNRNLALWPYTNMASEYVEWGKSEIKIIAGIQDDEALKIGFPNPDGWLAYWLDNVLFIKTASFNAASTYYDYGSSSEVYCNAKFVELETLAPISVIQPGEFAQHEEQWHLFANVPQPHSRDEIDSLIKELK